MSKPLIRCAIYTRKSSDEGLDQDFNSLDAQHEACAAYIASQRHEGWTRLPARYDDGGISGGTLERPGLQRLLADIDAGRVGMVVVYKIDRLTRSLTDFARLVERLDAAGCSFVSVTQAFNTSSSMGRLTLNVLLSFAQFEREVTAERIRDKITASKKKGLWMGGLTPLGYDAHPDPTRRELVVNETEALSVRNLFELYLAHGCLNATARAAANQGYRSKKRAFGSGRVSGGSILTRGQIHHILTNPVYRGQIRHKDKVWPGKHPAIIDAALWDRVQARLQAASARRRGHPHGLQPNGNLINPSAPLLGKFRDETGDLLTPTHTLRHGRRLRYYVSNRLVVGKSRGEGWRLPAAAFEAEVAKAIADHLDTNASAHRLLLDGSASQSAAAATRVGAFVARIRSEGISAVAHAIISGAIRTGSLQITLDPDALAHLLSLDREPMAPQLQEIGAAFTCRRRGVEMKIVAGDRVPLPDPTMLRALRNAHRWTAALRAGQSLKQIAVSEGLAERYVARIMPLATLSPRLQEAIVTGTHPIDLSLQSLSRTSLPLDWHQQETAFRMAR